MLKELLNSKKYREDFTELKRYAYQDFIYNKSCANEWSPSSEFTCSDSYKPLSYYFKQGKYIMYTPFNMIERPKDGRLVPIMVQEIISKGDNLEECLERTLYFISLLKSYNAVLYVYFATMDGIIELSSDTVITDFRDFNLNDEEIRIMRKALFEIKLM